MSQAKVDAYKKEKANRKKTMARNKVKHTIAKVCAAIACVAIVAWIGYSGVKAYDNKRPLNTIYCQTGALDDYLNGLDYSTEE